METPRTKSWFFFPAMKLITRGYSPVVCAGSLLRLADADLTGRPYLPWRRILKLPRCSNEVNFV